MALQAGFSSLLREVNARMRDRRNKTRRSLRVGAILLPLATGCAGKQSMLDPAGPMARSIAEVWWVMLAGSMLILALVMALAFYATYRRAESRRPIHPGWFIAAGGLWFPALALTALLAYGLVLSVPKVQREGAQTVVEVIGHRWWWEVRYQGTSVVTANEIHIPAGRPVRFAVATADIIHSFWVPTLGGKLDMIPGRVNELILQADRPGAFRGQCAEFCGAQHARMAFWVYALPEEEFSAWLASRPTRAAEPETEAALRGREQFFRQGCVECHTVRGTEAAGQKGPDLTHVASRRHIAAGTLPNTPQNLARWIRDNQRIKPGNLMEDFSAIDPAVLDDLVAYLATLK